MAEIAVVVLLIQIIVMNACALKKKEGVVEELQHLPDEVL